MKAITRAGLHELFTSPVHARMEPHAQPLKFHVGYYDIVLSYWTIDLEPGYFAGMIARPILSRFFAVLVGFTLLLAALPSFAAVNCCDPVNMAMDMPNTAHPGNSDQNKNPMNVAMRMADVTQQGTADQNKNMPCKMPAGSCASVCASMANAALTMPPSGYNAPVALNEAIWKPLSIPGGITRLPALPPPISIA